MKDKIEITFKGVAPLIMHNIRLCDPQDPITKEIKLARKDKTNKESELLDILDYNGAAYWSDEVGFYIPNRMLKAAITKGNTDRKKSKDFKAGIIILTEIAKLQMPPGTKEPKTLDQAYEMGLKDRSAVNVQGSRIMRIRPKIPALWSVTFEIEFAPDLLDPSEIKSACTMAGKRLGIGDWRPDFGRFVVDEFKVY